MYLDTARFRFLAEALNGSGGFRPQVYQGIDSLLLAGSTHLVAYPRESDEKFACRNQVAWYVNDMRSACSRFAGYLAKRRPQREMENPLFAALADDCDWRGNSLDVFWGTFTIEAKARGSMLLLVDMPRNLGTSQAEQVAARAAPYLVMIYPEAVFSLETDARGLLTSVEIADGELVRGWDSERWWVRRGELVIEQEEHVLGACPVLAFSEGELGQSGEFAQIADLSKRLFNLRSELDEILRAQTFSLLTFQVPPEQSGTFNAARMAAEIGTHNMLVHTGSVPAFIAPPEGPARIYLDTIAQVEERIRRIGHLIEAPEQAESGVALTIRFQQLNSALTHWSNRMEDLERRVWDLASRWLSLPNTVNVTWADDYAVTDLRQELDTLAAMQAAGFSDETLAAKRQQIVALDLGSLEQDDVAQLIEAEGGVRQER